jgi:hypothetical protein
MDTLITTRAWERGNSQDLSTFVDNHQQFASRRSGGQQSANAQGFALSPQAAIHGIPFNSEGGEKFLLIKPPATNIILGSLWGQAAAHSNF